MELKENDIVMYIDSDLHFPEFFPPYGTVGRVHYYNKEKDPNGCWVEWPEGSLVIPEGNNVDVLDDPRTRVRYCGVHRITLYNPKMTEGDLDTEGLII